jgi:hypothetical protein
VVAKEVIKQICEVRSFAWWIVIRVAFKPASGSLSLSYVRKRRSLAYEHC